jgi:hypothetical protein
MLGMIWNLIGKKVYISKKKLSFKVKIGDEKT